MSKYSVLVVWKSGREEFLKEGNSRVATFGNRQRADEMRDFMLEGMEDEVQSISVVLAEVVKAS